MIYCQTYNVQVSSSNDNLGAKNISSINILFDNQAPLARVYSEVHNKKSRHMSLRYNCVRKLIKHIVISFTYVKSSENSTNQLTKPLTRELVRSTSRRKM